MKTVRVFDAIYLTGVTVYADCTDADAKKLEKKYGEAVIRESANGGWSLIGETGDAVIVLRRGSGLPELVHELVHHAVYVFKHRGIFITHKHDEPFAYYMAMLVAQCKGLVK